MKKGLILEGGAMRGLFSCGVLDVFLENGISFDGAAGISAGAVFGCNFKSRQIGRAIRYNKKYCRDARYCSIRSLLTTGDLYGADFCYRVLPNELDVFDRETFAANPLAFYIGATSVKTGKPAYHLCKDGGEEDLLWMQASASMPIVSRPVKIGEDSYLDGGISDAVPYRFLEKQGYTRNVILLTQPKGYRKQKSASSGIMQFLLRRQPMIARAMKIRHEMYNHQMDEIDAREQSGENLVIRPDRALGIRRTENDPKELERVYQMGRQTGIDQMEAVRRFLT